MGEAISRRFEVYSWRDNGRHRLELDFATFAEAERYAQEEATTYRRLYAIVDRWLAGNGDDCIVWRTDGAPAHWGVYSTEGAHGFNQHVA